MESAAARVLQAMDTGTDGLLDANLDSDPHGGAAAALAPVGVDDGRRPVLRGPAAGWASEAATLLERRSRRSVVQGRICRAISASTRGPGG